MMSKNSECEFHDPGRLVDGDLELVLTETCPSDPSVGHVPMYRFDMRHVDKGTKMGSVCLRTRCTERLKQYGGHLSYDVDEEYRGNRYAARSCQLLFPLALSHGINTLWITCRPDNVASRRICELIGAEYVDTIETEREPGEYGPTCRYAVHLGTGNTGQQNAAADLSGPGSSGPPPPSS